MGTDASTKGVNLSRNKIFNSLSNLGLSNKGDRDGSTLFSNICLSEENIPFHTLSCSFGQKLVIIRHKKSKSVAVMAGCGLIE